MFEKTILYIANDDYNCMGTIKRFTELGYNVVFQYRCRDRDRDDFNSTRFFYVYANEPFGKDDEYRHEQEDTLENVLRSVDILFLHLKSSCAEEDRAEDYYLIFGLHLQIGALIGLAKALKKEIYYKWYPCDKIMFQYYAILDQLEELKCDQDLPPATRRKRAINQRVP